MKRKVEALVISVLIFAILAPAVLVAQTNDNSEMDDFLRRIERGDIIDGIIVAVIAYFLVVFFRRVWNSVRLVEQVMEEVRALRSDVNKLFRRVNGIDDQIFYLWTFVVIVAVLTIVGFIIVAVQLIQK